MTKTMQWIYTYADLLKGAGRCPDCGSDNIDHGNIVINKNRKTGYGAVWCNDCHHASYLSKVRINSEKEEKKVLSALPSNLVFA